MPKRRFIVLLWLAGMLFVLAGCFSISMTLGALALGFCLMLTAVMGSGD